MSNLEYNGAALFLTLGILYGIHLMSSPKTAVRGNAIGAGAMAAAIILTLLHNGIVSLQILWLSILVGSLIGVWIAQRVKMIQMPETVAFLNGFGGGASALVALMVLLQGGDVSAFSRATAVLALAVGGLTFSGSLIAGGKLSQWIRQKPVTYPGHSLIANLSILAMLALVLLAAWSGDGLVWVTLLTLLVSLFFGVWFTIRVGGADMPISISLLNSFSGVAGAIAGLAIYDPLLVAVGGIVGASGLLLTQIMCRAMNRSLLEILTGRTTMPNQGAGSGLGKNTNVAAAGKRTVLEQPGPVKAGVEKTSLEKTGLVKTSLVKTGLVKTGAEKAATASASLGSNSLENTSLESTSPGSTIPTSTRLEGADPEKSELEKAGTARGMLQAAKRVVIIPGYGMALAQAQGEVKQLADLLEKQGKEVSFAIHPVAGRMPGHMNVLLAEADVDYEKLLELEAVNPLFPDTDLVVIVGANDVVNPAANTAAWTPIYGMPILNAYQAKHVIVCNLDLKPGYAGVENPLYRQGNTLLLIGDARETVASLALAARETTTGPDRPGATDSEADVFQAAQKVIIVPGYGMALAQAQAEVKQLADLLEKQGKEVKFAIHPVAGRMPGHMNVLLAEVDVPYESLYEMDTINPEFPDTDLVLVVGANDVVNPAANTAEGTPIYGMPILKINEARNIIICNFDTKPGYAGVENPLYTQSNVRMFPGDAKETVAMLVNLAVAI